MGDFLRIPLRDWSLLPDDVIHLIVTRIKSIEDLIAISSICRSWRWVTIKDYSTKRVQLPWMMIFPRHVFETKGFFSIDRFKYYNTIFPNLQHSRYWGSKFGWLAVLNFDRNFHLVNPVTQARLDLPSKPIFKDEIDHDDRDNRANSIPGFIRKAFVFRDEVKSSADDDKYIIIAIGSVSGNLAFCRPGDKHWVHVKTPFGRITSAVWFNDRMFFLLGSGNIMSVMCYEKNENDVYEVNKFTSEINDVNSWKNIGLVESVGNLFMVIRSYGEKDWDKTISFIVYKMDFEEKEWVETKDLGDCALFVDADDNVFALKASEVDNCKSNSIYFIEKYWDKFGRYSKSNDVGVFYLKDGSIEPYFIRDPMTTSVLRQNPIWLMPSLC